MLFITLFIIDCSSFNLLKASIKKLLLNINDNITHLFSLIDNTSVGLTFVLYKKGKASLVAFLN